MTLHNLLEGQQLGLAEAITERHYQRNPELALRFGAVGKEKCRQDAAYHLSYLARAIETGSPALFMDYVAWAKTMLASRRIPASDLAANLEVLLTVVLERLDDQAARAAVRSVVEAGLSKLPAMPTSVPTFIGADEPLADLAETYLHYLLSGDRQKASALVLNAVNEGIAVRDVYLHIFQKVQHEIGRLWQENRISVAQEHYCTAATQLIMSQLYPRIFAEERNGNAMVAACVSRELHEIGVRMVADFFEMNGWDTYYLGANVPHESVIEAITKQQAVVLGISATMTFHIREVEKLIAAVRSSEAKNVRIMVGGYPFNIDLDLWEKIGADGSATDATRAVTKASEMIH